MTGHDVQFYRTDAHLVSSVVDFLADGLRAGQPIVVIATESHRRDIAAGLRAKGVDADEFLSGRETTWLDARDTLSSFMEGDRPNAELFMETVGRVFEVVLRKRFYLVIRAYGEMVDLLWRDGNTEGALELEHLWNVLAHKYAFGLLCGYGIDGFRTEAGIDAMRRVCACHSSGIALES
jgi:hypothetical protein